MSSWTTLCSPVPTTAGTGGVHLAEPLLDRLLTEIIDVHRRGLKSFGLLLADPDCPRFPYTATDVVLFDPTRNRRNDPEIRAAFEAQGTYFRSYDDAGFFADPADVLRAHRRIEDLGLEAVGMFHTHRRQPANFSTIDYRLHSPAYPWHLIVSLSRPGRVVVAAFGVAKELDDFGITAADDNDNSEREYPGPEVSPLTIVSSRAA